MIYKNTTVFYLSGFKWVAVNDCPVIEHALRERLALSQTSQVSSESEGLSHGKVGSDLKYNNKLSFHILRVKEEFPGLILPR
jgi:hypothetical protein